jgi:metal-responsive CopG/Arc/MetJ family transcriptional regulator
MIQRYVEGRAVIQLSLPTAIINHLNDLAIKQGTNRSALIRDAINTLYFKAQDAQAQEGRSDAPVNNDEERR